jgi:hypothetical protein
MSGGVFAMLTDQLACESALNDISVGVGGSSINKIIK